MLSMLTMANKSAALSCMFQEGQVGDLVGGHLTEWR